MGRTTRSWCRRKRYVMGYAYMRWQLLPLTDRLDCCCRRRTSTPASGTYKPSPQQEISPLAQQRPPKHLKPNKMEIQKQDTTRSRPKSTSPRTQSKSKKKQKTKRLRRRKKKKTVRKPTKELQKSENGKPKPCHKSKSIWRKRNSSWRTWNKTLTGRRRRQKKKT